MHARMIGRATCAALLIAASGLFATVGAPAAQAATGGSCVSGGSGGTSGGGGGGGAVTGATVSMWETLTVQSQAVLCPGGTSDSGGGNTNYPPPQCWWGPEFDPPGLAADIAQLDTNGGSAIDTYMAFNQEYAKDGPGAKYPAGYKSTDGPPWELYNLAPATPTGEWWGLIWSDDITAQGIIDCTAIDEKHFPEDWYWVPTDNGTPPAPGDAPTLDPYQLALYIQGKVKLNPLPIQTSPSLTATKATVGLPTWVWANAGDAKLTDQICTAPQYGDICVTMTAQAKSFTVSTDDSGATLYTDCKANADGTVGTPYTNQSGNPPCGVTFSQPGNWNLAMVTTWNVKIDYGNGQLNALAYTETDVAANVQEVQAVNN